MLCGGDSKRMGFDKWKLPVGDSTLLERVVQSLQQRCEPVVVSVNRNAKNLARETDFDFVEDKHHNCGPMEGIRAGLEHLSSFCDVAFVTACDIPFFVDEIVDLLLQQLGDADAVVPVDGERKFAMTALFRCNTHPKIGELIEAKVLKVSHLTEALDCVCLLYTSPSPRDRQKSRMPSSA